MLKECPYCAIEFEASGKQIFCGKKCLKTWSNRNKQKRERELSRELVQAKKMYKPTKIVKDCGDWLDYSS